MTRSGIARVVRLHGRRDLRLHEEPLPIPDPGRGDVLVRVTAVGLCGSDRHWFEEGSIGESGLVGPFVPGHELVGVIEGGARHGERVALDPADPCGGCELCRSGRGRLCPSLRFAGLPPTDGGLQQWMAWPSARCHPIPAEIGDEEGTLLEPLGVALHAVDLAGVGVRTAAGVYGAGPIGLAVIAALRAQGMTDIVATDPLPHRLAAAQAMGANAASPDAAASIPVDVAFECSGDDAGLETAVRAVRAGGSIVLVGIPEGDRTSFPASPARRKELALRLCRRMEAGDLERAIGLVAAGTVTLRDLVTHRYPLAEAASAFDALTDRRGLKVVVLPWA